MVAQHVTDDYYVCISKTDLSLLKKNKIIKGFFIENKKIFHFVLKVSPKTRKRSDIFFDQKNTFTFLITNDDIKNLFEKGLFLNRMGLGSNVYIRSEFHDKSKYDISRNDINGQFYLLELENAQQKT